MDYNIVFFSLTYKLYPNVLQTDAHIRLPSVWVSECVRAKFTFRRIVNYHVITDNLQWFCFFNFQHFSLVSLSHWFRFWCTTRSVYDKSRRTNTEVQTRSSDGRMDIWSVGWMYGYMKGWTDIRGRSNYVPVGTQAMKHRDSQAVYFTSV